MPSVTMDLSARAYKEFKMMMKKMRYDDEDLFMKYCVLKAVKPYATKADQEDIARELASIREKRLPARKQRA